MGVDLQQSVDTLRTCATIEIKRSAGQLFPTDRSDNQIASFWASALQSEVFPVPGLYDMWRDIRLNL